MKRSRILFLTAAYVVAFGYYGCKKSEPEAVEAQVDAVAKADPAATPAATGSPKTAYSKNASYFKLPNYKGGDIDLASYAGKPVMVMFFTEGCPYCRKAAPFIEKMHVKYSPKGLNTIGIALEDEESSAEYFSKAFSLTFPIAYKGHEVSRQYKAQGVPYIYLLAKDHTVKDMWAGYDPSFDDAIRSGIEKIIK